MSLTKLTERIPGYIYFVTSAPPGPGSQFVELEDHEGKSFGSSKPRWVELPDGLYALEIESPSWP